MIASLHPFVMGDGLADVVRPIVTQVSPVVVRAEAPDLDEPLARAADAIRVVVPAPDVTVAVRRLYKRIGIDPTKTRPSSEALLRRVRKGEPLPRVNSLVDVINWCSVETQLPYGLYDLDRIDGQVAVRLGQAGERYSGIRKDEVHLEGRLVLADARGPFGNPTSDSGRTAVTPTTTSALIVIFAPAELPDLVAEAAMRLTLDRLNHH